MNSEMFTLFWYTRAELALIRKQLNCFAEKQNDTDIDPDEKDSLRKEVDDIIRGVIQTLDDILYTESLVVSTLFLSHIIQSFTVHISNLQATLEVAEKRGITLFSLESNVVRTNCFITTLISIARANLVILCTTTHKSLVSNTENIQHNKKLLIPPMYQTRTPSILQPNIKYNEQRNLHVCDSSSTQNSSTKTRDYIARNLPVFQPNKPRIAPLPRVQTDDPTPMRDSTTDPPSSGHSTPGSDVKRINLAQHKLPHSVSRMGSSRRFVEEKIDQMDRLTIHLTSKDMLTSHEQATVAMQNSVMDNVKPPAVRTPKSRGIYFKEVENDEKPGRKKWMTAQNVVRTMARLRVLGNPTR